MVKEELMENWQQRTELLLGAEKMERLRKSHVLVVGLGGEVLMQPENDLSCRRRANDNSRC